MSDNDVFTQTRVPENYSHQIEDYHSAVILQTILDIFFPHVDIYV